MPNEHPDVGFGHTLLLGGAADGERVPLVGGDGGDVEVDVVPGSEAERARPLDHEVRHLGAASCQAWESATPQAEGLAMVCQRNLK